MDSVRILFEPVEEAMIEGLAFDPARHQVLPDGEWIRCVRRTTRWPGLFMYRHRETGGFVVGAWVFPPAESNGRGGVCSEIVVMSAPPDQCPPDRPTIAYMRNRCVPAHVAAAKALRNLRKRNAKRRAIRADSRAQQKSVAAHLKAKGHPDIAASVASQGYVGTAEGGDMQKEMVDDLARRASGKVSVVVPDHAR